MAKTLTRHVHVRHPEGGEVHRFGPGERPPEWAHELITNPKAWGDDGSPSVEELYAAQTAAVPPADEGEAGDRAVGEGGGDAERPAAVEASRGGRRAGRQNSPARA